MNVLNLLFYIILLFPIIWEGIKLCCHNTAYSVYARIIQGIQDDETEVQSGLDFIYLIIMLIGLFTFQWKLFLFIIVLGMFTKNNKISYITDLIVCILVLGFIILNRFHMHWQI